MKIETKITEENVSDVLDIIGDCLLRRKNRTVEIKIIVARKKKQVRKTKQ